MARPKRNAADDSLLHGFYESFGLAPKTIERAIELRYSEPPPRTYPRHSDIAKRMRHEPVVPKMRRPK
jgi:transposase InsO family protein